MSFTAFWMKLSSRYQPQRNLRLEGKEWDGELVSSGGNFIQSMSVLERIINFYYRPPV